MKIKDTASSPHILLIGFVALIALITFSPNITWAATVTLMDGTVYNGELISQTDNSTTIRVGSSVFQFAASDISKISNDSHPATSDGILAPVEIVRLSSGEIYRGTLIRQTELSTTIRVGASVFQFQNSAIASVSKDQMPMQSESLTAPDPQIVSRPATTNSSDQQALRQLVELKKQELAQQQSQFDLQMALQQKQQAQQKFEYEQAQADQRQQQFQQQLAIQQAQAQAQAAQQQADFQNAANSLNNTLQGINAQRQRDQQLFQSQIVVPTPVIRQPSFGSGTIYTPQVPIMYQYNGN